MRAERVFGLSCRLFVALSVLGGDGVVVGIVRGWDGAMDRWSG